MVKGSFRRFKGDTPQGRSEKADDLYIVFSWIYSELVQIMND